MSKTSKDIITFIQTVLTDHNKYWDEKMPLLSKYRNIYENQYWRDVPFDDNSIRVETPDAYTFIEGYISALFSRAPSVVLGEDKATGGDAELSKEVVNRWLKHHRESIEQTSRLALIFPNAFFKLSPVTEGTDILNRVTVRPVAPWDIIVDRDATSWDEQRYNGHIYYLPVTKANEKFGHKKYDLVPKSDYFDAKGRSASKSLDALPNDFLYIKVVEIYDMSNDMLYFWTPNYKNGKELLSKSTIPVRTYDDKPLSLIIPLYYARSPDKPLEGMSALARIYDQCAEKNILRTYWANAVRRDSRQFLFKRDAFNDRDLAKITAGVDGAMIPTDAQSLAGLIQPIQVPPISTNFNVYLGAIEADINKGDVFGALSNVQSSSHVTATEVIALSQYSASEIGKLARERDAAIERMARTYLRVISVLLEEDEKSVIRTKEGKKAVTPKDISGDFTIAAFDQGNTPISDSLKKQNLLQLIPVLIKLGIPANSIREEVIKLFELPETFNEVEEEVDPKSAPKTTVDLGMTRPETDAETLANALMKRGK